MTNPLGASSFTAWESSTQKACHRCDASWPAGTWFRWIPWITQWVCPQCAEALAEEIDQHPTAAAGGGRIPAIPERPAVTARQRTETATTPAVQPVVPVVRPGKQQRTTIFDGRTAVQKGLW